MADDLDIEAMLDEAYVGHKSGDDDLQPKHDDLSKDTERRGSKEKSRDKRSRSRRDRSRSRRKGSRSRRDWSKSGGQSKGKDRRPSHEESSKKQNESPRGRGSRRRDDGRQDRDEKRRSRSPHRRRSPKGSPKSHRRPLLGRAKSPELTPEERDVRTVFCMQLSARIRPRDLEDFFTEVGRVRDVRLITDPRTKKSKGVAYVEFREVDSVNKAIELCGRRLLSVPIIVKLSNAEKNRMSNPILTPANLPNLGPGSANYNIHATAGGGAREGLPAWGSLFPNAVLPAAGSGPMKLYIGSLHFNITEEMLRGIFEPFGRIDAINLMRDSETNRSRGYAFITFAHADDAKRALDQMNGFELAGRSIKVGHVTEKSSVDMSLSSNLDSDELDQRGISLGATGRLALMAKLADGSGLQMPQVAINALNFGATMGTGNPAASALLSTTTIPQTNGSKSSAETAVEVGTQCFMLSNMFDPTSSVFTDQVAMEIRDDVIEECGKQGGLVHIFVDTQNPQGNVYVKCPSIATAVTCVNSLHGRYFSGRIIHGNYIPLVNYNQLFPESVGAMQLVCPSRYIK